MKTLTVDEFVQARKRAENTVRIALHDAMKDYALETGEQITDVQISIMVYHHPKGMVQSTQVYDVRIEGVNVSTTIAGKL